MTDIDCLFAQSGTTNKKRGVLGPDGKPWDDAIFHCVTVCSKGTLVICKKIYISRERISAVASHMSELRSYREMFAGTMKIALQKGSYGRSFYSVNLVFYIRENTYTYKK